MAQADVKQSIVTVSIAHHTKTGDLVWSIFFFQVSRQINLYKFHPQFPNQGHFWLFKSRQEIN